MSSTLDDVQKLCIPSTQEYNIFPEISTVDVAIPFPFKEISLIIYAIVLDTQNL